MVTRYNEGSTQSSEYGVVGYTGHIPGMRDQLGQSYGFAATRLVIPSILADSALPLVEHPLAYKQVWSAPESFRDDRPHWITHLSSLDLNDSLNPEKSHISGYAGHVPTDALFGARYHRQVSGRTECGHFSVPKTTGTHHIQMTPTSSHNTPDMMPGSRVPTNSVDKCANCHNSLPPKQFMSVFDLPSNDPAKYTPTGYTGYLPSMRDELGVSFQEASRRAMDRLGTRFATERLIRLPDLRSKIVKLPCPWLNEQTNIYPVTTGMMPNYTGHLPGYRFQFGTTFGLATRDLKTQLASF